MEKCDEFKHKYKKFKYVYIKKYKEKQINIITKKLMDNCDCITIVISYVKNINLTIKVANVFSNVNNLRRNLYFLVPNCRWVYNSRSGFSKSKKRGKSF